MSVEGTVRVVKSNILDVEIIIGCKPEHALLLRNELLHRIPEMNSAETSFGISNDPEAIKGHCVTGAALVKIGQVEKFEKKVNNLIRALNEESGVEVTSSKILVQTK